ncbi:MAG: lipoyl(octanoyl) transferase LipB [Paracoccaceae bacterium]|tara:strand:+ start:167 stop:814 length:648 start_codon:yes stop_codon:yes gene_type:complete
MEWIISKEPLDYAVALEKMEKLVNEIIQGNEKETIWLLEHNEIYTAGTSTKDEHIQNVKGAPIFKTNRGGQLTFHGPGQRIVYLMINLSRFSYDIRKYVSFLEQLVINTLYEFNISTHRWDKAIGVWTYKNNDKKIKPIRRYKIASIGIRIRKKISFHGISVNIHPNLNYFNNIIPCGLENSKVTSVRDLGINLDYNDFDDFFMHNFEKLLKINS